MITQYEAEQMLQAAESGQLHWSADAWINDAGKP